MFFKKKKQAREVKMPANLTRKQQKEIKTVIEKAKRDNGVPQTAQDSIPFQRMFPDGICRVKDNYYTKTRTSIISWHSRKIKQPFLMNGVGS